MEIILNPVAINSYLTFYKTHGNHNNNNIYIYIYYHENYNYLSYVISFILLTFKSQDQ